MKNQDGLAVPLGAHMRRMNPRDGKLGVLTDVKLHRIVRRSTTYGAPYDPNLFDEGPEQPERGPFLYS